MRKGKNVIGQPVISFADGRRVDTVKDLLLSESQESIAALLVDEGGLLSSSRVVPIEAVQSFGRDGVIISAADAVIPASKDPDTTAILNRNEKLLGKKVMTDTGDQLGAVSDIYFEEGTGKVQGLEISAGMVGDITRGAGYLPVADIERMGPDVVFVTPDTGAAISGKVGGLVGMINKAGDSIGGAVDQTQEQIQARLAQGPPEDTLVGRLSGSDVADENGSIMVANGQRITADHVRWAQETNNTGALTKAAAAGTAREYGARAGAAFDGAADNLGQMWDKFTSKLAEARDANGRQVDYQATQMRLAQIADGIGRPVTKVILDRSDNVILDFGDIITHQAVQQAYDSNMLDTLLASAYRGEITIPVDAMRAGQPASSSIEKASGGASLVSELEQKVQQSRQEEAERKEQRRAADQAAVDERERERTTRARSRQQAENRRVREIEAATKAVEPVGQR